jgi:hypothetical protein
MLHALTAQIVFSGLIAVVPVSSPPGYKILMPEASGDQYAANGCPLPKHTPLLVVLAVSCQEGTTDCPGQADLAGAFGEAARNLAGYMLEGKDVTITFTKPLLSAPPVAARTPSGTVPRDRYEARSSSWIPKMPRLERVEPSCLNDHDIGECPLAARANINGGSLETCHIVQLQLSEAGKDQLCASRFKTARWSWLPWGRLAQAVADGAALNFDLQEGTQATIVIKDLKQTGSHDLTWKLTPGSASPNLVIWIVDEPLSMYDNKAMSGSADPCTQHPEVGAHYQLFYNLAARDSHGMPVPPMVRPYPVKLVDCVTDEPMNHQPETPCPWFIDAKRADGGGKYPFYHGNITHCGLMTFRP